MLDHPWPGNVRELKHCLERACILFPDRALTAKHLLGDARHLLPAGPTLGAATLSNYLDAREREYIEQALAANDKRIADTAAVLGISRKNLWEKMKKLGVAVKSPPPDG